MNMNSWYATNNANSSAERGASLLEVLFALLIFAVLLVAVASGFEVASNMNQSSRNKILVANDAKKIMEQVRALTDISGLSAVTDADYWENVSNTGWLQTQSFSSDTLDPNMSISFPEGTLGDPLRILVSITWSEKGKSKTYQLQSKVTQRVPLL